MRLIHVNCFLNVWDLMGKGSCNLSLFLSLWKSIPRESEISSEYRYRFSLFLLSFFFFFTLRYLQSNIIIPCEIVMKEICFQGISYVYHRFILPISRDIAILGVQYYGQNIYFSIFSK